MNGRMSSMESPGDQDPRGDAQRWERLVGRITTRAEPILAARRRRREDDALLALLGGWARPALAAAASVLVVTAFATGLLRSSPDAQAQPVMIAEALLPPTVAAWVDGRYEPTLTELVIALDEGDR